ncbi:MAG: hypothetical protein LQ350_004978 [Teloschistes chrysophthalmus]|nr:MAG: hypothetical protein LQ350_004978 [Niorma chrysophthalma]
MRRHQASVDKVMAWNDESVGPPGSMLDTKRVHPAFRTSHVSFSTNIPSRSLVRAATSHTSPAGASAFIVSSPGDVSPFSLNSSPATAPSKIEPSTRNPKPDQGDKFLDDASRTPGFIAPIPSQLNKLATKPGRPTLSLKIPDLLSEPVEGAADAGSGSEANIVDSSARNSGAHQGDSSVEYASRVPTFIAPIPSQPNKPLPKPGRPTLALKIPELLSEPLEEAAHSGSDSESSSKTTPIATPAHAKRLPAQAGTRAAKTPKKISLSDELGAVGETLSGSAEQVPSPCPVQWKTSVHDWAHEKHRYTSPGSNPNTPNVASEPVQHGQGVTESLNLGTATIES